MYYHVGLFQEFPLPFFEIQNVHILDLFKYTFIRLIK